MAPIGFSFLSLIALVFWAFCLIRLGFMLGLDLHGVVSFCCDTFKINGNFRWQKKKKCLCGFHLLLKEGNTDPNFKKVLYCVDVMDLVTGKTT